MKTITMTSASFAFAFAAACGGEPPEPQATILSFTPETLDPADDRADDLSITVEYIDGDGDLGGGVATIHDCRADDLAIELLLPAIASDEAVADGVAISGELVLTAADVGDVTPGSMPAACSDLGAEPVTAGNAVFCVVLTDAGGRSGVGDCTTAIPVIPG
jgi:hypothetical protein